VSDRPDQRPMRALPVLEESRAALETCAFCPKLCRSACPVSNAEPTETLTPWGKMTTSYVTGLGDAPLEPDLAAPAWACTGCRACSRACDHENDVATTLLTARRAFHERGLTPPAALGVIAGFEAHRRATHEASTTLPGSASADSALLIGCAYVRKATKEAHDAVTAARGLVGPVRVVDDCCGLPLLHAGDHAGFVAHARAFAAKLRDSAEVVVVDPGCGVALRKEYARLGVELPPVSMLVERAAARLNDLSTIAPATQLRWHDPCQLGRGLGLFQEPRAILTRVLGRAPNEQLDVRERGRCSGGGGLLPVTMPEVASKIALDRTDEHEQAGGGELVTACASSLVSLRRAARGRFVVSDLATWIARSLGR
jgi:Fe-S oxidoreductase